MVNLTNDVNFDQKTFIQNVILVLNIYFLDIYSHMYLDHMIFNHVIFYLTIFIKVMNIYQLFFLNSYIDFFIQIILIIIS